MPRERENLLSEAHSAFGEAIRENDTGSAHTASLSRFRTCTANARTKKSCPRPDRAVNSSHFLRRFRPISQRRWPIKRRGVL